jgi:hypothetical protein
MFREHLSNSLIEASKNPWLFVLVQCVVSGAVATVVALSCDYFFNKTGRK